MANGHTTGNSMRVDDDIWTDTLNCKRHILEESRDTEIIRFFPPFLKCLNGFGHPHTAWPLLPYHISIYLFWCLTFHGRRTVSLMYFEISSIVKTNEQTKTKCHTCKLQVYLNYFTWNKETILPCHFIAESTLSKEPDWFSWFFQTFWETDSFYFLITR